MFRPDFIIAAVDKFHYLHFGAFSFLLTMVVCVGVSYFTTPPSEDKIQRLTWDTRWGYLPSSYIIFHPITLHCTVGSQVETKSVKRKFDRPHH